MKGHHYVMWYSHNQPTPITDEIIDTDIAIALIDIVGQDVDYQFGWYENPKMSVPGIYHVQVFWTEKI